MALGIVVAAISEAVLSGLVSGAVGGLLAGAAVSIRVSNRVRSATRTSGDQSPAVSVGGSGAVVAGDYSTISQSFVPPAPPASAQALSDWIAEVRRAVGDADHAYKLLNRQELAFEAVDGLVDAGQVHRDALDAQRVLHSAALGATSDRVYELLDTMERRLQGAANGFAFAINYLSQHPRIARSQEGRERVRESLEAGLAKLESGEIRGGRWTDDLSWVDLQKALMAELRSVGEDL